MIQIEMIYPGEVTCIRLFLSLHFPSVSALALSISSPRILVNPLMFSGEMHLGEHYALECVEKKLCMHVFLNKQIECNYVQV